MQGEPVVNAVTGDVLPNQDVPDDMVSYYLNIWVRVLEDGVEIWGSKMGTSTVWARDAKGDVHAFQLRNGMDGHWAPRNARWT
jgi:hypothetical protein